MDQDQQRDYSEEQYPTSLLPRVRRIPVRRRASEAGAGSRWLARIPTRHPGRVGFSREPRGGHPVRQVVMCGQAPGEQRQPYRGPDAGVAWALLFSIPVWLLLVLLWLWVTLR